MLTNTLETPTVHAVQRLYRTSKDAKDFFTVAKDRTNNMGETTIDTIMTMAELERKAAVELGKALQTAGCGTLIFGRSGKKTRFKWDHPLTLLAKTALGAPSLKDIPVVEVIPKVPTTREITRSPKGTVDHTKMTMDEMKTALAAQMGIKPSCIKISIEN